ncbi:polyribonucleotide 5 -hydroxyl-kinase Clp1 [Pelobates cultripes]|uniref:Polyribonucleotide 5 -hydroxyl-kinase Clp1 n=1 Tax=Pelobates cultripes TaxID=61616 RepID=A0AAD1S2E4_PELCU|nr:polyribonucleotide 5 -hydroxyl-kinase Clp1 [Pelobates cultripes]
MSYVFKKTPMPSYLNIHVGLEQMRIKAELEKRRGPRVLLAGPSDAGKSTLCRILLNYAVRIGRQPTLIELDVELGSVSVPGTVGALCVEKTADIERGFSDRAPDIYHYGSTTPTSNVMLYNKITSRLAEEFNRQCDSNRLTSSSGCIINTGPYERDPGYESLIHMATAFDVDVILVLDEERLYHNLLRDLPHSVQIIRLLRSGGAIDRSEEFRRESQDQLVREYFYGPFGSVCPHAFEVKFSDVKIYKAGAPVAPDSCVPMGTSQAANQLKYVPVTPSKIAEHHLLSVVLVDDDGGEESFTRNSVEGFILITGVDTKKQTIKLLSPTPMLLPKCALLIMDVIYKDQK